MLLWHNQNNHGIYGEKNKIEVLQDMASAIDWSITITIHIGFQIGFFKNAA
jgi:hypothetical protein